MMPWPVSRDGGESAAIVSVSTPGRGGTRLRGLPAAVRVYCRAGASAHARGRWVSHRESARSGEQMARQSPVVALVAFATLLVALVTPPAPGRAVAAMRGAREDSAA